MAEFIEDQGHRVKVAPSDGRECNFHTIEFKSEGLWYYVTVGEDDPEFFLVGLNYSLPDPLPPADLLRRIAHDVCAQHKATKIEVRDARMVATVEQFFETPDGFKPIFWRCVRALGKSAQLFFEQLREATPPDPEREAHEAAERFLLDISKGEA
jgi:hypothetical protein